MFYFLSLLLHCHDALKRYLFPHPDLCEHLRVPGKSLRELTQGAVFNLHGPENLNGRDQTIAGETDMRKNDMTRLLTAQDAFGSKQFVQYILITHISSCQANLATSQCHFQS